MVYYKETREYVLSLQKSLSVVTYSLFSGCAAPPDKTLMNEMVEMVESSEEEKKNSQDRIVKI